MKKTKFTFLLGLILILSIMSCASRKDVVYLYDLEDIEDASVATKIDSIRFSSPVYKIDDRLTINVSSSNSEAAAPYNLPTSSFNTGGLSSTGQQQQQSFLVDEKGYINFPRLGKINVVGKNRVELEAYLIKRIQPFLSDVKVNIQLVNFRISVLGEVTRPGSFTLNREKMTIFQALSLAEGVSIHGKRNNIKLIREDNGIISYYNLDISTKSVVNSPAYYVQQNDVIYVAPNKARVNASTSSPTNSYIISATGLLITIISLLTR